MSDNIVNIRNKINNYYKEKKEEYWKNRHKQQSKRRNSKWNKYYHDNRWQLLRTAYYTAHPLCECCLKCGYVVPGEHIHHITRFDSGNTEEAKYNLLLNVNNLVCLCRHHHDIAHKYMHEHNVDKADIDDIVQYENELDKSFEFK